MALTPTSPEAKLLAILCEMRIDQGFLTPERLAKETGLHVKLVGDALRGLEAAGAVAKEDDLLKKWPGEPARGSWWKPTLQGYAELYGQEAAEQLKAKALAELERQTQFLPDADAIHLGHLYVNFDLIQSALEELERQGLAESKPSLTFSSQPRWELTGQGARVLDESRQQTLATSELGLDF